MEADDHRSDEAGAAQIDRDRLRPVLEAAEQRDHARGIDEEHAGLRERGLDARRHVRETQVQLAHRGLDVLARDDGGV
jgi:hypothetical protein